jgi:hypothetical protein
MELSQIAFAGFQAEKNWDGSFPCKTDLPFPFSQSQINLITQIQILAPLFVSGSGSSADPRITAR